MINEESVNPLQTDLIWAFRKKALFIQAETRVKETHSLSLHFMYDISLTFFHITIFHPLLVGMLVILNGFRDTFSRSGVEWRGGAFRVIDLGQTLKINLFHIVEWLGRGLNVVFSEGFVLKL